MRPSIVRRVCLISLPLALFLTGCAQPKVQLETKLNTSESFSSLETLRQQQLVAPVKSSEPKDPPNRRHVLVQQATKDQYIEVPSFDISANFQQANLRQVLQGLMDVAGLTLLLDIGEKADELIDLDVESGSWDQVIRHLFLQQGLIVVFDPSQSIVRVTSASADMSEGPFMVRLHQRLVSLLSNDTGYYVPQMQTEFVELFHIDPVTTKAQIDLMLGYGPAAEGELDQSPIKTSAVERDAGTRLNHYASDEKGNPTGYTSTNGSQQTLPGLIVTDTPENIQAIVDIVENLDRRIQQVFIEAFIVSVSDDFQRELGSRIALSESAFGLTGANQLAGTASLGGSSDTVPLSTALPGRFGSIPNGSFNLLTNVGIEALRVEIKALEQAGFSRTIANPKIMVINREKGFFRQGQVVCWTIDNQESIANDDGPPTIITTRERQCSDGTSTNAEDSLPDKQLGLTLEVVPTISHGDNVILDIGVHQVTTSGALPTDRPPNTVNMDLTNRMIAKDGEIIVIGGNHALVESNSNANLPGQKGSNVLGMNAQNDSFKEMLIFLSVRKI